MKSLLTICGCVIGSVVVACGALSAQEVGSMYHVTGCENEELLTPTPTVWRSPERLRVVGRLTGQGAADQGLRCQGAVVRVLDRATGRGGVEMVEIRSLVNSRRGWMTTNFISREVRQEQCREIFSEPVSIARCEA